MSIPKDFSEANRRQRRIIAKEVSRKRASGNWGEWEQVSMPIGFKNEKGAKLYLTHKAYQNDLFTVIVGEKDGYMHLGITLIDEQEPSWKELQRIKNEIVGADKQAIQIYPPQDKVTDRLYMYHLWVLPNPIPIQLT